MRIVLIAGLECGRRCAQYLAALRHDTLVKVYVLQDALARKVSDYRLFDDIIDPDKLVKVAHIDEHAEEIAALRPDYIVVVGWSQLLSQKIISSAQHGCMGFHPAKLPRDRGRSVLAWQIAEGYEKGCVSMFLIDAGIDSGKIIGQQTYDILYSDTIRDVLDKMYRIIPSLLETYYPLLKKGLVTPQTQDAALASYRRLRKGRDGEIQWNAPSRSIYNLVRAITKPYPCAHTFYGAHRVTVVACQEWTHNHPDSQASPGTIVGILYDAGLVVKTRDGHVLLREIEICGESIAVNAMQGIFQIGQSFHQEDV